MDMRSLLTLSVLLALIREDNGQKPTVSLLPKFPDVFVGDDVTLICNGGGEPIKWFFNGDQQSHNTSLMLQTSVTSKNDGMYQCERAGSKSDPYTLTVLELEPHAQLSPSVGGTVVSKGGGRNMELQVEDDLKGWKCYVLRGESGSRLQLTRVETEKKAVMFAELKEAKRATFWCKKDTQRSNAVTLKMTELKVMLEPPDVPALMGERVALRCAVWGGGKVKTAVFYKNHVQIKTITEDTYIIDKATQEHTGEYSCHATFRYSHISAEAAEQKGDSDAQELKVIGGPPATTVNSTSPNSLRCSCSHCPVDCTSYRWYHTPHNSFVRQTLAEITEDITVEEVGRYSCRKDCGKGFSRFSNIYIYNDKPVPSSGNGIMVAGILLVVGVLIVVVLVALKRRRSGGNSVQATARDKDKTTGGDYEQIQLTDQAVYHTLGEGTDKDKVGAEGGYEALKKRQEEAVYHTLGAEGGQGQGEGQGEGQGGYEALKGVKAEVYQTLSSADSKTPAGESEGKYEQLPQKDKDNEAVTVEENPYEELKAGQQDKKEMSKEKE